MKVLAAIASGVPVVTTPAGAEGIDADEGVVVETDDRRLANAALELLRDPAARREHAAARRAAFHRRYAPKPATEPLVDLYRRMVRTHEAEGGRSNVARSSGRHDRVNSATRVQLASRYSGAARGSEDLWTPTISMRWGVADAPIGRSQGGFRLNGPSRRGPSRRGAVRRASAHPRRRAAVGAVVCGGDYLGLGIVRSLGRQGVPVCVVDDEYSIARFSRYTACSVRVPNLREEANAVEAVLDLGKRRGLEGWVLYPTREEIVAAFSRHRSTLAEVFRVPTPAWNTVKWAWDKRNTYRLAKDLQIAAPRTWCPEDVRELDELDLPFPVVIKPAIKERFFYATKAKAWRADTKADLVERYEQARALLPRDEIMVQEAIPGDGRYQFAFCTFFKDGRSVGSMVARRRRQHPPDFGRASTYVETVKAPLLEKLSARFLAAIEFYGLAEVEYKLDPRDGQHKLLDVNMRAWGYHSLGPEAGVDFSYLLFADQVGESVETCRAAEGIRWIRLVTDVPTAGYELLRGALDWRGYVRSLSRFDTEAVFSRDDPLPGLAELALVPYLAVRRGF